MCECREEECENKSFVTRFVTLPTTARNFFDFEDTEYQGTLKMQRKNCLFFFRNKYVTPWGVFSGEYWEGDEGGVKKRMCN